MALAENPKARFDYQILETFEAGLVLKGYQVKAIKSSKCSIKGTYVKILDGGAYLLGAIVSPYQTNNIPPNYDQQGDIKLLLKKNELDYLRGKSGEGGISLVPIKLYGKNGLVKLEFGVGRIKKKYDKREIIKKREIGRNIRRKLN